MGKLQNDGKEFFDRAVSAQSKTFRKWKDECVGDMSEKRNAYLRVILERYNGQEIPFKHFESVKSYSNELIYPIICAYHIGYFRVDSKGLVLKKEYANRIKQVSQETLQTAKDKINRNHPNFLQK